MSTVKLRTTDKPQKPDKLKSGLPGDAKQRRSRIKEAIAANRETLRRLARPAPQHRPR